MLPINIDAITGKDIAQLVSDKVPESRIIEYKAELPAKAKESDTLKFLAQVSSFANAGGGDIVYGIAEDGQTPGAPSIAAGVDLNGETADEVVRRFTSACQNSLDPAIPGLRVRAVDGEGGTTFFVVRIPKSWIAPHMVTGSSKFYLRIDNGKVQMDREQIRQSFLYSESARTRLQRFRDDRLGQILSGEIPVKLRQSWIRVLHVVPTAGLDRYVSLDLSVFFPMAGGLPSIARHFGGPRANLDGAILIRDAQASEGTNRYMQVFRWGAIEFVRTGFDPETPDNPAPIPGKPFEKTLIDDCADCFDFLLSQSMPTPLVVFLTMINVKGRRFAAASRNIFAETKYNVFDRYIVTLPELNVEANGDAHALLQPLIPVMWQAAGYDKRPEDLDNVGG